MQLPHPSSLPTLQGGVSFTSLHTLGFGVQTKQVSGANEQGRTRMSKDHEAEAKGRLEWKDQIRGAICEACGRGGKGFEPRLVRQLTHRKPAVLRAAGTPARIGLWFATPRKAWDLYEAQDWVRLGYCLRVPSQEEHDALVTALAELGAFGGDSSGPEAQALSALLGLDAPGPGLASSSAFDFMPSWTSCNLACPRWAPDAP